MAEQVISVVMTMINLYDVCIKTNSHNRSKYCFDCGLFKVLELQPKMDNPLCFHRDTSNLQEADMSDKIKGNTYFVTECSTLIQQLFFRRRQVTDLGCQGMTLVELIVVVAILGVLATMAVPSFEDYIRTAKIGACASDLRVIDKAVTAYYIDRNVLPEHLSDVGMDNQLDPWKNPYVYNINSGTAPDPPLKYTPGGDVLNTDYDLYSKGADGATNLGGDPDSTTKDDIARANDGAFIGGRP